MGHTSLQNPVIDAIFLAWDLDGRERARDNTWIRCVLGPPVEPSQTLFSAFLFSFLFSIFFFPSCRVEFRIFYFELPR